jgi:serine/threonine-protein kinase
MATVNLGTYGGKAVVVKRLHAHLASRDEVVATLRDEARIGVCLRHPNIGGTLGHVRHQDGLVLVSEYVHGESLAVLLRRSGQVPVPVVLRVALDMLAGLDAAHRAVDERANPLGLVHRDVTPHNVMVGADGLTRVIDFGIALCSGRFQRTKAGDVKGKFPYLAPEQLREERISPRTDVYACAAVIWEMLAGRRLFDGPHEAAVIGEILRGHPARIGAHRADLAPGFAVFFARALARDARLRYASARETWTALSALGEPASPREVGAWVARTAGNALRERALAIAELERAARSCWASDARSLRVLADVEPGTPAHAFPVGTPRRALEKTKATRRTRTLWEALPRSLPFAGRPGELIAFAAAVAFFAGCCMLVLSHAAGIGGAPPSQAERATALIPR